MTWILFLNDMRHAKSESLSPVCRAATRAELEALIERESVGHYTTERSTSHSDPMGWNGPHSWHKSFREGGPLEWYNPPMEYDVDQGSVFVEVDVERRVADFRASLERELAEIPHVGIDVEGGEIAAPEPALLGVGT